MEESLSGQRKILVCLNLNLSAEDPAESKLYGAENARVLTAAKNIGARLGAKLRLLHVCEPDTIEEITGSPWQPMFQWQEKWLADALYEQKKRDMDSAKKILSSLVAQFDLGPNTETHVVSARHASHGILADAVANDASLILLSAGVKSDQYFARGHSTPLAVMASAMLPVLVLGQKCKIDFSEPRLRILVADDLRESTSRAMQKSTEWAAALGSCDVCHIHVEEMNQSKLKQILTQTASKLRLSADSNDVVSDLLQSVEDSFKSRLAARPADAEEQLKKFDGTFRFGLRRGPRVRDEIDRVAESFNADMLVFGRHQKLHYQPFQIGRVTWHAMLSHKHAVMLIP